MLGITGEWSASSSRKATAPYRAGMASLMCKVPKSIDRLARRAQVNVTFVNRALLLSLVQQPGGADTKH
jgi:hypothetical protein